MVLLWIVILHSFICNFMYMCNVNLEGKIFEKNNKNNLSPLSLTLGLTWDICDVIIKSTIFKSNVVIKGYSIEVIFITRRLRNSIANH